ncbi:MAG: choloylglycine hydrolase [Clostridia bacterium]|nr:choloylglycine hydrolase [Clostridia bacterium]
MCTAVSLKAENRYFGRNLDLDVSYNEAVTVTMRRYPFRFTCGKTVDCHYAIIGMAAVVNNYPLYFEATNEKGLSMAGLNFPDNAVYFSKADGAAVDNVSPFEFIPWVLSRSADIGEARKILERVNLCDIPFSRELPLSPLHWFVSDGDESIVVESVAEGLKIYDDPLDVLTNNPPFPYHLENIKNYINLKVTDPEETVFVRNRVTPYSVGLGAFGLPGDYSSASRFVRASFVLNNTAEETGEKACVNRFFHILSSVAMPKGCVKLGNGRYEYTRYSCCCNADKGVYYYTTYENREIRSVDMYGEGLDGADLVIYPI